MKVKIETKKYLRVVGYYAAETSMNKGKREENDHRKVMTV